MSKPIAAIAANDAPVIKVAEGPYTLHSKPAIMLAREVGIKCSGPYPADTLFKRAADGEFDGVEGGGAGGIEGVAGAT